MAENSAKRCNLCGLAYPDLNYFFHCRYGSFEICGRCGRAAVRLHEASGREFALVSKQDQRREPSLNPFVTLAGQGDPQPDTPVRELYVAKELPAPRTGQRKQIELPRIA